MAVVVYTALQTVCGSLICYHINTHWPFRKAETLILMPITNKAINRLKVDYSILDKFITITGHQIRNYVTVK